MSAPHPSRSRRTPTRLTTASYKHAQRTRIALMITHPCWEVDARRARCPLRALLVHPRPLLAHLPMVPRAPNVLALVLALVQPLPGPGAEAAMGIFACQNMEANSIVGENSCIGFHACSKTSSKSLTRLLVNHVTLEFGIVSSNYLSPHQAPSETAVALGRVSLAT